ncbi:hypothetical protein BDY19DRAFT_961809 [Irpex rosettiformis]|uniref:Uncharacterized protein n=1 Tax=Irpex rosettiformis TaxID=378272 RepID=A0ACB8TVZ0_9APHY|nr:hypothetical protein BDY19DRAFT_961809 [Irpex rosettiformis]
MHAVEYPYLPRELWLDIFRWATVSRRTLALTATDYSPFESDSDPSTWLDEEAIATKRALVRVCKEWRCLARSFLYEDVVLTKGGCDLKCALQETDQDGYWPVRRVCLPYSSCTPWESDLKGASDIVKECPRLEVLVRPFRQHSEELIFDISAEDCPCLTALKRLDWWHYNDAARTGGFNSLPDVLDRAPNLQYLSLTGDLWLNLMRRQRIVLPKLTTLRLRRVNVLFIQELCRWYMPSLEHVILDTYPSAPAQIEPFWEVFGHQITTVELGRSLKFHVLDLVSHVLSHCPNLEELNYYVQFTAAPHLSIDAHERLHTIRLHASPNEFLTAGGPTFWEHVEEHILAYDKSLFPALRTIVLHGDWKAYLPDPSFDKICSIVAARGCSIAFDNMFY